MHAKFLQLYLTLCNPMDCTYQAPLSLGFSRPEFCMGCRALIQEIFPTHESNLCHLCLLHWKAGSLYLVQPRKPNKVFYIYMYIYQFSSVTKSCPTLCDPVDCSTPDFPVHHQLLELAQTHVHQVGDAIQTPHPLSCLSPPAFNLSQQ